jgi:outer membrane lipoprotein carrier protein
VKSETLNQYPPDREGGAKRRVGITFHFSHFTSQGKDMLRKLFITLILLLASTMAHAAATDKLKTFIAATHSAQADFTQEVQDKNGKRIQFASGTMQFQRPGKFRWVYQKPYEQLIVGDGQKFWMYDVDLNQVTVKKLDAALGSSPAALLSGNNEIERDFVLTNIDDQDGLEWLQAKPKSAESTFANILLGFNSKSELVEMKLHDAFGHQTILRFIELKNNPSFSPLLFNFVPPKGADVLGE